MGKQCGLVLNLVVRDALEAMGFYERVFGAKRGEVFAFPGKRGCNEANVTLGGVELRLMDANPAYDCHPPKADETDSVWLQMAVDDVAETLKLAQENGAAAQGEPGEFMGVVHAQFTDPFGYVWTIHKMLRELSFAERYKIYEEINIGADAAQGQA